MGVAARVPWRARRSWRTSRSARRRHAEDHGLCDAGSRRSRCSPRLPPPSPRRVSGFLSPTASSSCAFYFSLLILWLLLGAGRFPGAWPACAKPRAPASANRSCSPSLPPAPRPPIPRSSTSCTASASRKTHRQLRAAAGLLVQPRRLDDVLHLRDAVHRPGLRHRTVVGQQITMLLLLMVTSKGMAGVPRASLVVIAATLATSTFPKPACC